MKAALFRLLSVLLVLVLLFPAALAAPNGEVEVEFYDQVQGRYLPGRSSVVGLTLDGAPLSSDVPAVIWQSRTMIPVRLVSEHLGATVSWISETGQVVIRRDSDTIVLTLGSASAVVNGQGVLLPDEVPATVMRYQGTERTMVPLRFVSEQLGGTVEWDQSTYTASIRPADGKAGRLSGILADANAQTILLSTTAAPQYRVQDLGDRVVVDLLGMELSEAIPPTVTVDNELISGVRHYQHDSSLFPEYPSTVRVVFDLKDGVTFEKNVAVAPVEKGVVLTTFLPDREESDFTPSVPLDPAKKTVVVDAGHGGTATGAKYEDVSEKDINLKVAKKLEVLLKAKGYNVVMTRTDDSSVGLYDRADIANAVGADLFVSLHSNASATNLQAQGIYTYHYPTSQRGAALASAIQGPVTQATGARDRGTMSANFVVLRETKMPAVLVEMGFMSTHEELMRLIDDSYQDKLASGVAEGIVRYLNAR